jgi:hypothetical protein
MNGNPQPTAPEPRRRCDLCDTDDFVPSWAGLCTKCVARFVREHPERRIVVTDHAIRFVVPGSYPARREPKRRAPDDITDPWELAEHRGDPDPEDVWHWKAQLERIHAHEPNAFEDEHGHLFGPLELVPVYIVRES